MLEVNVRCAGCGNGVFVEGARGACSRCAKEVPAPFPPEGPLERCALCGRRELFRQRDFNRRLGLALATAACLAAFVLFLMNLWFVALGLLVLAALADLALFFALPLVAVCYACGAIHRGIPFADSIQGYNLAVADRHEKRTGGPTGGVHA